MLVEQRHGSDGDEPHTVAKLFSLIKDVKQDQAQSGISWATSDGRSMPYVKAVDVDIHIISRRNRGLRAIL